MGFVLSEIKEGMSRYLSSGKWYISDRGYTRRVISGILRDFKNGKRDYICDCIYRKTKRGLISIHQFTNGWYVEVYGMEPRGPGQYGFFGPPRISINNERRIRFLKEILKRL